MKWPCSCGSLKQNIELRVIETWRHRLPVHPRETAEVSDDALKVCYYDQHLPVDTLNLPSLNTIPTSAVLMMSWATWLVGAHAGMHVFGKSTFLKPCLPHDLALFYHWTHYANGQRQAPLCQRAATAFRGSVQVHQVLMSQERNQQRHRTLYPSTLLWTICSTQVQQHCHLFKFLAALFLFRERLSI